MMSTKAKLIFLSGIFLLGLASLGPIWRIEIWAPQYPEGLVLQINTNSIQGNVNQINILNHYIGMKKIIPAEIPELRIIPRVLYVFVGLGLLIALFSRHLLLARIWLGSFFAALALGLYDFYMWGYDYGHNLNPDAPIQIPGLSYQPPLIGHKTLLNIQSYSLPDWGGYVLFCAIGLLVLAVIWDKRCADIRKIGIVFASFLTLSCTAKPEPFKTGADHCEACKMTIMDARFGGEVITKKGRVYKFDSMDCLMDYYHAHKSEVKETWVNDFNEAGHLVKVGDAYFMRANVNGPMGSNIIASKDQAALKSLSLNKNGAAIKWADLILSSTK
jgi:copper chaperone NosL